MNYEIDYFIWRNSFRFIESVDVISYTRLVHLEKPEIRIQNSLIRRIETCQEYSIISLVSSLV